NLFAGLPIQPMSVIPLLQQAMSENKVSGEIHSGVWVDVGTPERLQEVQERYAASGEDAT
ncbi:MAG: mannose-1-phosphate guanylyltransferase, partial [Pseudomonadota bacterium]|nr:mannose-1-phosphate guanylyltransferase [Pseudomonadota bacterium]